MQIARTLERWCSSVQRLEVGICKYLLLGVLAVPSQSVCLINSTACRVCEPAGQEAPAVDSSTQIPDFKPMYVCSFKIARAPQSYRSCISIPATTESFVEQPLAFSWLSGYIQLKYPLAARL